MFRASTGLEVAMALCVKLQPAYYTRTDGTKATTYEKTVFDPHFTKCGMYSGPCKDRGQVTVVYF